MKKIIPYVLVFVISFLIAIFAIKQGAKHANKKAQEFISNYTVNTNELSDGLYKGKFKYLLFTMAEIEFTIKNGLATDIQLRKLFQTPGSLYKNEIEHRFNEDQTIELDAISGATRTSNFAKAAIKNAIIIKRKSNPQNQP